VLGDSSQCWAHDPALAEKRAAKRRLGGQNRATSKRLNKLMPARLVPVYEQLETALAAVLSDTLDPRSAAAAAAVARAMVAVLNAGLVEQQIEDLRQQIAQLSRRPA
jgi:hypothetical protein